MKAIKKTTLLLLLITCTISFGQEKGKERIKTLKIAHLTERLSLTPEEAQKFWPIYNAHEAASAVFHKTKKDIDLRKKMRNVDELNEEEAASLLEKLRVLKEKQKKEKKAFITTIQKEFSAKKALQLMAAEDSFKRRMLHRYKSRHDETNSEREKAYDDRREKLQNSREEKQKAYEERRDKLLNERNEKRK